MSRKPTLWRDLRRLLRDLPLTDIQFEPIGQPRGYITFQFTARVTGAVSVKLLQRLQTALDTQLCVEPLQAGVRLWGLVQR